MLYFFNRFGVRTRLRICGIRYSSLRIAALALIWLAVLCGPANARRKVLMNRDPRRIDSLEQVVRRPGPVNYEAVYELMMLYSGPRLDKAVALGNSAYDKAYAAGDYKSASLALLDLSSVMLVPGHLDSARIYLSRGMALSQRAGPEEVIEAYMVADRFYEYLGLRDSSLYALLQAEYYVLSLKDEKMGERLWGEIGNFYYKQGVFDKALIYRMKELKNFKGDSADMAPLFSDIGNTYYWQKNYRKALEYYLAGYRSNRFHKDSHTYGYLCNNIGLVYQAWGKNDSAKAWFGQSVSYYKAVNNSEGLANVLINLAQVNDSLKEYGEGQAHARTALDILLKMGKHGYGQQYLLYGIMADLYFKQGLYPEAYQAQLHKTAIGDTIKKQTPYQNIADIQIKYETAAQNAENRALKAQKEERDALILLIGVVSLLLLVIILLLYRNGRRHKKNLLITTEQNRTIEQKNKEITRQKHELETAGEFRVKLFSIISHDVKEPLSSVQAYLTMKEEGMLTGEESAYITEALSKNLNNTLTFIENLLAWARLQIEGFSPDQKYLDVREILQRTISLYHTRAGDKHITVNLDIPAGQTCFADAQLLEMVARNLLSNAIKFTPEGGAITIACKTLDDKLEITVTDTGAGMPQRVKELLFTGKRNSSPGTANESGHGLGLIFCRDSLLKSGGDLYLISSTGQGTVFGFVLPLEEGYGLES